MIGASGLEVRGVYIRTFTMFCMMLYLRDLITFLDISGLRFVELVRVGGSPVLVLTA